MKKNMSNAHPLTLQEGRHRIGRFSKWIYIATPEKTEIFGRGRKKPVFSLHGNFIGHRFKLVCDGKNSYLLGQEPVKKSAPVVEECNKTEVDGEK